jgi:hypothetical protein
MGWTDLQQREKVSWLEGEMVRNRQVQLDRQVKHASYMRLNIHSHGPLCTVGVCAGFWTEGGASKTFEPTLERMIRHISGSGVSRCLHRHTLKLK